MTITPGSKMLYSTYSGAGSRTRTPVVIKSLSAKSAVAYVRTFEDIDDAGKKLYRWPEKRVKLDRLTMPAFDFGFPAERWEGCPNV